MANPAFAPISRVLPLLPPGLAYGPIIESSDDGVLFNTALDILKNLNPPEGGRWQEEKDNAAEFGDLDQLYQLTLWDLIRDVDTAIPSGATFDFHPDYPGCLGIWDSDIFIEGC